MLSWEDYRLDPYRGEAGVLLSAALDEKFIVADAETATFMLTKKGEDNLIR